MTQVIRQEAAALPAATTIGGMQVSDMAVSRAVATRAEIEARYQLALLRPRDLMHAREKLLALCANPDFATEALYRKPTGGKDITGLSIRFVEAALQCLTNMFANSTVIAEDDETRVVRVTCTDLEANVTHATDVSIAKTVERSRVDAGRRIVGERFNTRGRRTYILAATDDEVWLKQNNLTSKAIRNCGLRLVPSSILAEAERMLMKGAKTAATRPDASARVLDAFAALGVDRAQLESYLECPVEKASPEQIADLRQIHTAITEGEATWADVQADLTGGTNAEAEQAKNPIADAKEPYGDPSPRASGAIPPRPATVTEEITEAQGSEPVAPPSPVRKRRSNYDEGA